MLDDNLYTYKIFGEYEYSPRCFDTRVYGYIQLEIEDDFIDLDLKQQNLLKKLLKNQIQNLLYILRMI